MRDKGDKRERELGGGRRGVVREARRRQEKGGRESLEEEGEGMEVGDERVRVRVRENEEGGLERSDRVWQERRRDTAVFFWATLLLWAISIIFEISFNKRRELFTIILGFLFYQIANWVIQYSLSSDPLFVNTAVSLLHSSITSTSVVLVLVNQWMVKGLNNMFDHNQLVGNTWPGAYSALCLSCGYFAYDQLDMLRYRLYSGWIPSILVHHLILPVCFTLALYRNVTINYLILTLVCELHSIFLHIRKIRRMAGFRNANSRMVNVEWKLNWATFFMTRLVCHILITYKLIVDSPKFGRGIELPLALFGMAGMNLLNFFLGLDLLRAHKRERSQKRRRD